MGMILGFFLLIYILVAIGIYKLTKRFSQKKWVHRVTLAFLILLPTYDIIITNVLGAYYCLSSPNPKTYIAKKVEYPESIYWEDNIYPGFNAEDRKLMIINYLDGKHLQKMALNGDDGKVYVYESNKSILKEHQKLETTMEHNIKLMRSANEVEHDALIQKNMSILQEKNKLLERYTDKIIALQKVYFKRNMPQMNYTVTFDEVSLNFFANKFLYSDETKVINNNTSEVIAYNRRYMHFFYNIAPDFALGNRYYEQYSICGDSNTQYFFKKVFQKIFMNTGAIAESFNSKLYRKYKKRER